MINLYKKYNLNPKSSSGVIFRKLQRVYRNEIKENKKSESTLKAFLILSNITLRKFYDKALQNERIYHKLKTVVDNKSNLYASKLSNKDEIFSEQYFLAHNAQIIIMRSLGMDFLFHGVSYKSALSNESRKIRRGGLNAFGIHTLMYFGVPLFLSYYDLKFLWTFIPILTIKLYLEYWAVKHEYYFDDINNMA